MGSKGSKPKIPQAVPKQVATAPDIDSEETRRAAERTRLRMMASRGREGTILTGLGSVSGMDRKATLGQ